MLSILIVEKDSLKAEELERALGRLEYGVTGVCSSVAEALAVIERSEPDLILMGVTLDGDTDGMDASKIIRRRHDIPLAFISSDNEPELRERAEHATSFGCVHLPVSLPELKKTLEAALYKHRPDTAPQGSQDKHGIVSDSPLLGVCIQVNDYCVYANSRFCGITGYSREELQAMRYSDIVASEPRQQVKGGHEAVADEHGVPLHYESLISTKSGETRRVEVSEVRIQYQGRPAVMCTVADLTAEKRSEQALTRSEARFRSLFDQAAEAIFVHDCKGRFLDVNRRACESLGYSKAELLSMSVKDVDPHAPARQDDRMFWQNLPATFETFHKRKDGTLFAVEVRLGAIEYDESEVILAVARDVSARKESEEALRRSEQRYRTLISNFPNGALFLFDEELRYTLCGGLGLAEVGLNAEDLIGRTVWHVFPEEVANIAARHCKPVFEGIPTRYEVQYQNRVYDNFAIPVPGNDGGIREGIVVTQDITDRKRAEEACKKSERLYRTLFDCAADSIFVHDLPGRFLDVNQAACNKLGYSKEEFLTMSPADIDSGEFKHLVPARTEELMRKGQAVFETAHVAKDGRTIPIEISSTIVDYDGKDAVLSFARDVTERKTAEEALRDSEERYRRLVENANEAIFVVQDGAFKFVNTRCAEISGYTLDELSSMSFTDLIFRDDRDEVLTRHRDRLNGNYSPWAYSFRFVDKNGHMKWVHMNSVGISWDRRPAALCCVSDITDMKRAEELAANADRLRAVGELAGGVAHNFNNLLQIVLGCSQLALTDLELGNVTNAKRNLDQIVESARFGAETVKRLQDFAQIRKDGFGSRTKVFDFSHTVEEAIEMTKPWWKTKPEKEGVSISLTRRLQGGCFIKGIRGELFEVVVNLIKNAAEAMDRGGEIRVTLETGDENVVLMVKDQGRGIPREDIGRVFEPFWTTKGPQGTGMGLAGSYGIVHRHRGKIMVESSPGQGTVFTVLLPSATEPTAREDSPELPTIDFRLDILVVDDMPAVIRHLESGLSRLGQNVFSASSGEEAVELFREAPMDVVVSDLAMPGMNGWQVGEAILTLCRERGITKPIFIILTGWGGQKDAERRIRESGVDLVLEKPVDIGTLAKAIEGLYENRQA